MNEELVVGFTPVRAAERTARWHGKLRTQIVLLAVAVVFVAGVALWRHGDVPLMGLLGLGLLVALPLVLVAIDIVFFTAAKRDLDTLDEGQALLLTRRGITVRDIEVLWRDVARIYTRPGGLLRSSLLAVEHPGGRLSVPLDFIDRSLADIDAAVRQASSGRVGVEVSPLEVVQRA